MRRALIIIAVFIVILGVAVATFLYFTSRTAGVVVAPTPEGSLPTTSETVPVEPITPDSSSTPTDSGPISVVGKLAKISAGPVVPGEIVVNVGATNASSSASVAVNYIERQSGNVYSYRTNTGTISRVSNKTLPGIQSATWLPDGSTAFVRYISGTNFTTINTYALSSSGASGFFLPQNLTDVAISSTSVLSLASGVNGTSGSVAKADGSKASIVFTTPLSSLRASFAGAGKYLAFTKPSATLEGAAFIIDKTGRFSRIAGPLYGLVALSSHNGKWVLVSHVKSGAMELALVNTATNESIPLPLSTIADKCVWSADDSSIYCGIPINPSASYAYPDDWYQGAVQFSDRIWKIDVAGRFAQLVLDFSKETSGSPDRPGLDAIALALDPLGTTLAFVNKNDGSLWSYQL